MKKKLVSLVEKARKQDDLDTLNQAIDLNDTLGLLSKREEDIFTWGVVERWHKHQFSQILEKGIRKSNGRPIISLEGKYAGRKDPILDQRKAPKGVTKLEVEMFLYYHIDYDTYHAAMNGDDIDDVNHWEISRNWINNHRNQSEKEMKDLFEDFKKLVEKESLLKMTYEPPEFSREGSLLEYTFWGMLIIEEISL